MKLKPRDKIEKEIQQQITLGCYFVVFLMSLPILFIICMALEEFACIDTPLNTHQLKECIERNK